MMACAPRQRGAAEIGQRELADETEGLESIRDGVLVVDRIAGASLIAGPVLQPEENLGNPALIDTFHTALRSHEVMFGEKGRSEGVTVRLGADKVPAPEAVFVTWTLADDSPYYCVEPWMGPANAAEHKVGLHLVNSGETKKFAVSVSVK